MRLGRRGTHTADFWNVEALSLATSLREAMYLAETPAVTRSGVPAPEFSEKVCSHHLLWAPDGDEAFDDSSYVLHFDADDGVRLIAFRCLGTGHPDPESLREVCLSSDGFYGILAEWHVRFEAEWRQASKVVP